MKFVVIQEVDGKEVADVVEADSPIEAINTVSFNEFFNGDRKEKYVATIGVYDMGGYNHLIAIDKQMQASSWATERIIELEDRLSRYEEGESDEAE